MAKEILFSLEARQKIASGVSQAAHAVKVTLGPRGRNVVLDKGYGSPRITNDGVSIAKEITLKDKFENMGAEIVKEVASKTNDLAGDGTTTSVVLFEAMVQEGMKHTTMGVNAMAIRAGMEKAKTHAVAELKKLAKPVSGNADVKHVATISAESENLGAIIAEVIQKVGKDGVVTVEESQGTELEYDVVEGIEFDKGYVSAYMVTNTERLEAEYRDAPILLTDKKISSIQEILPLLEKLAQSGKKELVIIADDVDGEALSTFVVNKLRGTFSVLAIKAPGFGDRKKDQLEDIATTTGATVISEQVGITFENATLTMLGKAQRVVASKDATVIVGGKGKKADIDERVQQLKAQLSQMEPKNYARGDLEKRIAKLSGGVAVNRVGAATETEMKYLKDKIDDAVKATKASIEEGIVPGGGSALAKVAEKLRAHGDKMPSDERIGYDIVTRALEMPLRQIATNAGKDDGYVVVANVQEAKGHAGYDAIEDKIIPDMIVAGIIDPVKVTRSGVEHAVSAAAILLTTEAAIADIPEPKPAPAGGGGMGMDY